MLAFRPLTAWLVSVIAWLLAEPALASQRVDVTSHFDGVFEGVQYFRAFDMSTSIVLPGPGFYELDSIFGETLELTLSGGDAAGTQEVTWVWEVRSLEVRDDHSTDDFLFVSDMPPSFFVDRPVGEPLGRARIFDIPGLRRGP